MAPWRSTDPDGSATAARPDHGGDRGDRVAHARSADALVAVDVGAHRHEISELLVLASKLARAAAPGKKIDRAGADLIGVRLQGAKLAGADLRGACLIAADLSGADLTLADLLGADTRDTNFSGALLAGSIFLTQSQLNAANGDEHTTVPASLARPPQWSSG